MLHGRDPPCGSRARSVTPDFDRARNPARPQRIDRFLDCELGRWRPDKAPCPAGVGVSGRGRDRIMDLIARLPQMEDAGLATLHQNAERLQQTGTPAQKNAAKALMPALEAELAGRREAKLEAAKLKRQAGKRSAKSSAA